MKPSPHRHVRPLVCAKRLARIRDGWSSAPQALPLGNNQGVSSKANLNSLASFGTIGSTASVMELIEKYRLGELVRHGAIQTHAGLDLSSGAKVLIHRLSPGRTQVDLMRLVVRRLRDAPRAEPSHILDMFESQGNVYVVTDVIEVFSDLETWLGSEVGVAEASRSSAEPGPPPHAQAPTKESGADLVGAGAGLPEAGAGTPIFQTTTADALTPTTLPPSEFARQAPPAPHEQSGITQKNNAAQAPGEFTRLFESPRAHLSHPTEQSAPHFPVTSEAKSTPGEFTQFFQPSLGDAPEPLLEDAGSSGQEVSEGHEPGELTRILRPGASSSVDSTGRSGFGFDAAHPGPQGGSGVQSFTGFFAELSAKKARAVEESGSAASSGTLAPEGSAEAGPLSSGAESSQKPAPSPSRSSVPSPPAFPVRVSVEPPKSEILKGPPTLTKASPSVLEAHSKPVAEPPPVPSRPYPTPRPPAPGLDIRRPSLPPTPSLPETPHREAPSLSVLPLVLILAGLLLGVVAIILIFSK